MKRLADEQRQIVLQALYAKMNATDDAHRAAIGAVVREMEGVDKVLWVGGGPLRRQDTKARLQFLQITGGVCPACMVPGLRDGPRGGGSRNMNCTTCGAKWNVTYIDGFAERVT